MRHASGTIPYRTVPKPEHDRRAYLLHATITIIYKAKKPIRKSANRFLGVGALEGIGLHQWLG